MPIIGTIRAPGPGVIPSASARRSEIRQANAPVSTRNRAGRPSFTTTSTYQLLPILVALIVSLGASRLHTALRLPGSGSGATGATDRDRVNGVTVRRPSRAAAGRDEGGATPSVRAQA